MSKAKFVSVGDTRTRPRPMPYKYEGKVWSISNSNKLEPLEEGGPCPPEGDKSMWAAYRRFLGCQGLTDCDLLKRRQNRAIECLNSRMSAKFSRDPKKRDKGHDGPIDAARKFAIECGNIYNKLNCGKENKENKEKVGKENNVWKQSKSN